MAWFSIKPDPPYWMDEPFSFGEAQIFLSRFVTLLRERGYFPRYSWFSLGALQGIHVRHPDLPRNLSIIPRETAVLAERRYEVEVSITGGDHSERIRSVVMSTDGPDTRVTPERLLRQLEETFFCLS